MSMINGVGPNSPAATGRLQQNDVVANARSYDASKSSLLTLSQPQQEGFFEDFLTGVWSVITWPFRAAGSFFSWLFGATKAEDEGNEKKSGLGHAFDDLIACFKKEDGEDFDSTQFKDAYKALSSEQAKVYRGYVHIQQKFETSDTKKDAPTKLLTQKDDFDEDDQEILKKAADLAKASSKLKSLADRFEKYGSNLYKELDKEDGDIDFEEDKKKLEKEIKKLPEAARERLDGFGKVLGPHITIRSKKEGEMDRTALKEVISAKNVAYAMKTLANNHFLAASSPAARDDLVRMLRVITAKKATEGDIQAEYSNLGSAAKKVLAEAVGCAIGKHTSGEQYIGGKLKVDGKIIAPDIGMITELVKDLVAFDGDKDLPKRERYDS